MNVWYGGIRKDDIFTWSDKTPFTTTFWAPGEPNGPGRENCMYMTDVHIGQWNDIQCDVELNYVCKLVEGWFYFLIFPLILRNKRPFRHSLGKLFFCGN